VSEQGLPPLHPGKGSAPAPRSLLKKAGENFY